MSGAELNDRIESDFAENLCGARIFVVANALEADAPTRLLLAIAARLRELGGDCHFFAWSRGGVLASEITQALGKTPLVLRSPNGGDVGAMRSFAATLAREKPQVVHAILTRPGIVVPPITKLVSTTKVVLTQHGTHEWSECRPIPASLVRRAFCFSAMFADAIVAVSRSVAQELTRGIPRVANKIVVIPNGVDTRKFSPEKRQQRALVRARLFGGNAHDEFFLVGGAGNLRPIKGYDVLVKAARLLKHRANLRFVVWGDGEQRQALEELLRTFELQDRFLLPGWTEDIAACMAACDCFVQPSRGESFGLAAAEAMACGVPVIASDVGGLAELIQDGVTGLLVPPEAPRALALTLDYVIDRPHLRELMGRAARQRICACFSMERMQHEHLQLYATLLQKKSNE
ncbi:MAG: glycosyltransferase family 4 protein [Candidatus Sumerlaeaceae bacterium]